MTQTSQTKPYTLAPDERATLVVAYTVSSLVRGEVVTRDAVRVSTWLRTQGAPEYVHFYNAQVLVFSGSGPMQSLSFTEYYLHASQIAAYHIAPPAKDPMDYDATEPNRKMEPVTMLVGAFRFNGFMRMATPFNIGKQLDLSHETFTSLYDVEISNPSLPNLTIKAPLVLVRPSQAAFATRA